MTRFYLVRHGSNDWLGRGIAGRQSGVHLNDQGRAEAAWAARTLTSEKIDHLVSSPLERALETAEPLARALNLQIEIDQSVQEIDFGDWSGRTLAELEPDEHWQRFHHFRTLTRPPNGETMIELQQRFIGTIERLRSQPARRIAIFSHADPIRACLCYFLGMPLDFFNRLEISPGSISVLQIDQSRSELLGLNFHS